MAPRKAAAAKAKSSSSPKKATTTATKRKAENGVDPSENKVNKMTRYGKKAVSVGPNRSSTRIVEQAKRKEAEAEAEEAAEAARKATEAVAAVAQASKTARSKSKPSGLPKSSKQRGTTGAKGTASGRVAKNKQQSAANKVTTKKAGGKNSRIGEATILINTTTKKTNKRTKQKENADVPVTKNNKTKAKRAASEDVLTTQDEAERPVKKAKTQTAKAAKAEKAAPAAKAPKATKAAAAKVPKTVKPPLRNRPETPMNVYVTGTGEMGELGLGPKVGEVYRPRLNPFLDIDQVGSVGVAVGGMHTAILTKNGQVMTWGVNDHGALGRDTKWEAPEVSADANSDSDDEDELEINPLESTPKAVEGLPEGTNIVDLACSDSLTIATTDAGLLYAWGTIRCNTGILGFSEDQHVAERPVLLPNAKDIVQVVTGTDHVLALNKNGNLYAWGNGEQYQLGRRVVERTKMNALTPREMRIPRAKIRSVGSGSYHCFAVAQDGKVYAWGLNQYGQCGIDDGNLGQDAITVAKPTHVKSLSKYTNIVQITAGEHHSCAVTEDGKLLAWGRVDGDQLGVNVDDLPKEATIYDDRGKPRIVTVPTVVKGIPPVASVSCGTHHTIAICKDGSAYSWGFNNMHQAGQGKDDSDILVPTVILNTAVKSQNLTFAGCGGQFSVLAGVPKEGDDADAAPTTNGVANGV